MDVSNDDSGTGGEFDRACDGNAHGGGGGGVQGVGHFAGA